MAQFSCVEEKTKQEVQNRTWHLCIWETFVWDFDSVLMENVLQWKKNHTYGNSLKNRGQTNKKMFFFLVLIVIVHACLFREEDMFVIFEMEKRSCFCSAKKGPMIQTLSSYKCYVNSVCSWNECPLLCTWFCLAHRPWSSPVSSPVHKLPLDHISILFTSWMRVASQTNMFTSVGFRSPYCSEWLQ